MARFAGVECVMLAFWSGRVGLRVVALLVCATAVVASPARGQHPCARPDQIIERPPGSSGDFGDHLAASANWLAVGDGGATLGGERLGAVFVYRLSGDTWDFHQRIDPPTDIRDFGRTVSITDDALLVAARDRIGLDGEISFYRLEGDRWQFNSRHTLPGGAISTLAFSVDLEGDFAIAGATGADTYGRDLGAAFTYRRDSGNRWVFDGDITPDVVRSGARTLHFAWLDRRGTDLRAFVAVSGGSMVPLRRGGGAWEELEPQAWPREGGTMDGDLAAHAAGRLVKLLERDGERFVPLDHVVVETGYPEPSFRDSLAFGRSDIAAPADLLVVGDPYARVTSRHGGRALLFSSAGGTWRLEAELMMPDGAERVGLGSTVAMSSGPGRRPFAFARASTGVAVFALDQLCGDCPSRPGPASDVTLTVRASGPLTPANPQVTIDVIAWFPHSDYALAAVRFDVEASEPALSDPELILTAPGTSAGVVAPGGEAVRDVFAAQLNWWPILADPANPILLWTATLTTADLRPRDIELRAIVGDIFDVYLYEHVPTTASHLGAWVETTGVIRVRQTADCDGSGVLDFADFLCFQDRFAAGDLRADFDADGELTFFDFLAFQDAFTGGCP